MSRIYVADHITLDGVVQGPGRPAEDTRDGFVAGGWAAPGVDATVSAALNNRVVQGGGLRLLLGRRSYEGMLGYWNTQDSPYKAGLNDAEKFVASTTLRAPLPWPNSAVLAGDVPAEVAKLKDRPGADLCIMGSGELIRSLLAHRLIDEFLLFIHPLILGSGRRLFPHEGPGAHLQLQESSQAPSGVIIAHYQVADTR